MVRRASLALLVVALVGACGGGDPSSPEEVGAAWAEALDDEDWARACDLMADPKQPCERRLASEYAGRRVRLLEAGGYQEGANVTDNVTKFAITADRGGDRTTSYYEVERTDGRNAVDVKISIAE